MGPILLHWLANGSRLVSLPLTDAASPLLIESNLRREPFGGGISRLFPLFRYIFHAATSYRR
jgi:hypothetical protein